MDDTSAESVPSSSPSALRTPSIGSSPLPVHLAVEHVRDRADQDAVRATTGTLTWRQVGSRAYQLATLLRDRGVGRGDHVIVSVPSSELLPVALLGVLLAGAVYVPVDASYPDARVNKLSSELGTICTVADRALPNVEGSVLVAAATTIAGTAWDDTQTCQPLVDVTASDTAYVIFTSGSTGTPHGVAITHGQITASTHARSQFYPTPPTSFAMVSSISFDSSLVGLFWSLAQGFPLVLADHLMIRDADALLARLDDDCPSHLLSVPTLYAQLLERRTPAQKWPRHVIVAGEACRPSLVARHFSAVPTTQLTNEYGPTEGTIWATAHHCDSTDTDDVPIGKPIPGMWTAVVNDDEIPVAEGIVGELIIGGPQVTTGYINGERAERFGLLAGNDVPAEYVLPGDVGDRFFRTGDRVVQRQGKIYFLGRNDDQLSIAGTRIEPVEIEAALATVPGVTASVVLAQDPRSTDEIMLEIGPDAVAEAMRRSAESTNTPASLRAALAQHSTSRRRLVAHVEGKVSVDQVRTAVEALLPGSHRPSVYVVHDVLPRRTAGKIDREQLYDPASQQVAAAAAPTATSSTGSTSAGSGRLSEICALFADSLNRDRVGPDDSFFDLGGDSLGAFAVMTAFEEQFGVRVDTGVIHRAPTPRQFAKEVNFETIEEHGETDTRDETDEIVIIEVQPEGDTAPIFMLHHVGVNGRFARVLSRHLGESTPVFAAFDETAVLSPFLPPSPRVKEPNIANICLNYANAIEKRWPTGPIVLLGHCQGGVIVHEVAHLLTERGRTIPSMIVVNDWHAPEVETFVGPLREIVYEFKREPAIPLLKARAKSAQRRLVSMINPNSAESKHQRMVAATNHAYHTHTYTKYDGRVLIVRRKDDPRWPDGATGWGDVLSDLTIEFLEGEPFKPTGAPGLAALVQAELH